MSDIRLGEILSGDEVERDAVHMAVIPVIAGQQLHGGQHVGLNTNGEAVGEAEHIGIIDPFIKGYVKQGENVYLLMYPQTVTVVRHAWTHPAFEAVEQRAASQSDKVAARAYLDKVAKEFSVGKYTQQPKGWDNQKDGYWYKSPGYSAGYTADALLPVLEAFINGDDSYTTSDGERYGFEEGSLFNLNSYEDVPDWFNKAEMFKAYTTLTGRPASSSRSVFSFCC